MIYLSNRYVHTPVVSNKINKYTCTINAWIRCVCMCAYVCICVCEPVMVQVGLRVLTPGLHTGFFGGGTFLYSYLEQLQLKDLSAI